MLPFINKHDWSNYELKLCERYLFDFKSYPEYRLSNNKDFGFLIYNMEVQRVIRDNDQIVSKNKVPEFHA